MNKPIDITTWEDWLTVSALIAMHGYEVRNYELLGNGNAQRLSDNGYVGRPYRVHFLDGMAGVFYQDQGLTAKAAANAAISGHFETANHFMAILKGGFEDQSQDQGPSVLGSNRNQTKHQQ